MPDNTFWTVPPPVSRNTEAVAPDQGTLDDFREATDRFSSRTDEVFRLTGAMVEEFHGIISPEREIPDYLTGKKDKMPPTQKVKDTEICLKFFLRRFGANIGFALLEQHPYFTSPSLDRRFKYSASNGIIVVVENTPDLDGNVIFLGGRGIADRTQERLICKEYPSVDAAEERLGTYLKALLDVAAFLRGHPISLVTSAYGFYEI